MRTNNTGYIIHDKMIKGMSGGNKYSLYKTKVQTQAGISNVAKLVKQIPENTNSVLLCKRKSNVIAHKRNT